MNIIYSLLSQRVFKRYQVVAPTWSGHVAIAGRSGVVLVLLLGICSPVQAVPAVNALPSGEQVVSGRASLNRLIVGRLVINQHSDKLVTNWDSFDIGANASVIFKQPDAGSIALNRITTGSASQIFGKLDANGQIFIVNPAGITFGAGSQLNTGSLLASTLNISDSDFLSGDLRFVRDRANGRVTNEGSLNAATGNVVLLSPTILSEGSISANAGNIFIVSADSVRVQDNNAIVLQAPVVTSIIRQSGALSATSVAAGKGKILLIADKNHAKSEMKVQGSINAQNSWVKGKDIVLTGALTVEGNAALEAAGYIEVTGAANFLPDTVNGQQRLLNLTFGGHDLIYNPYKSPVINLPGGASQTLRVNGKDYQVISSISQLQAIGSTNNALTGRYALGVDIDARDTANWNNGAGFSPIGNSTPAFSGELYGFKHSVYGLIIKRPTEDRVALFGYTNGAAIYDLTLRDFNIQGSTDSAALAAFSRNSSFNGIRMAGKLTGKDRVGMLSGFSIDNTVKDSSFSGQVEATGLRLGGLIGYNRGGLIEGSGSLASIRGTSSSVIGGLIGYSENAVIRNSSFYGALYRTGSSSVYPQAGIGGLVGYLASGEVQNSSTTAAIRATGIVSAGLVGVNNGTIADSYTSGWFGAYNGGDTALSSGLVAINNGLIQRSYSNARVWNAGLVNDNRGTIEDSYYQGIQESGRNSLRGFSPSGLVSYNRGLIQRSYVLGNVESDTQSYGWYMGGLVGTNYSTGMITDSWIKGDVISTGHVVGGLVGNNLGTLKNSYAQGSVSGASRIGGAVGENEAAAVVDNVWTTNSVKGSSFVGGLVGVNYSGAVIRHSSASGNVDGRLLYLLSDGRSFFSDSKGTASIGGLAGYNLGQIEQSVASSSVTGGTYVGGLVGRNALSVEDNITQTGTISNSYALGSVDGLDIVGGLVGNNDGIINHSYAAGQVTGKHAGGLAGLSNSTTGVVNSSYWNVASVGKAQSSGGKGLTDALSKQKRMYAGWDIGSDAQGSSVWYINEGVAMPVLRSVAQP